MFDFSNLAPQEQPVTLPDGKKCVVVEASAGVAKEYRNCVLNSTKLSPDGKTVSITGAADAEPMLVQRCLFELVGDKRVRLSLDYINALPGRFVKTLFEWIKLVSSLGEDAASDEFVEQMDRALSIQDSPVAMTTLLEYFNSLPSEGYERLKSFGETSLKKLGQRQHPSALISG